MKSTKVLKKAIALCMTAVITAMLAPRIEAQAYQQGDYEYEVSGKNAVIKSVSSEKNGEVKLPQSIDGYTVSGIAGGAFTYCRGITKIYIPETVSEIADNAFSGCSSLLGISVSDNNGKFCAVDGVLFDKKVSKIICYPAAKEQKEYSIPNTVRQIGGYSFFGNKNLNWVKMPESVEKIGEFAFSYSSSLWAVQIPHKAKTIGEFAFARCPELEAALVPEKVEQIGSYAFAYCPQLDKAELFCDNADIGAFVFKDCAALKIYGFAGTEIQDYADNNGISFSEVPTERDGTVSGISIDKAEVKIAPKGSSQLKAEVNPGGALSKAVIWRSDDEKIASVTSSGKITGKKAGTTVIKARTVDGGFCAQCTVTVLAGGSNTEPKEENNGNENKGSNSGGGGGGGGGETDKNTNEPTKPDLEEEKKDPDEERYAQALADVNKTYYITGYADGSFKPDAGITRAEAAVVFARISGEYDARKKYQNRFSDVQAGDWFANQVGFAAEKGIITVGTDGRFRPSDKITRAEFSVMAARFTKIDISGKICSFSDCRTHWAKDYISALSAARVINGYSDGTFRPQKTITRAEMVKLVNTILGKTVARGDSSQEPLFTDVSTSHWAYWEIAAAVGTQK